MEPVVEIVLETKESIIENQLWSAIEGHDFVVDALGANYRDTKACSLESMHEALSEWLTDERLELVNDMKEKQPGLEFTLIATPNVLTTTKDLIRIAEKFGADQTNSTYVWEDLYKQYSVEQLSGATEGDDVVVNFALIPSQFTPGLESTVAQQRTALANMQAIHPELKVPSVLDAVTYWATLRAQSESLTGEGTFNKTYIRHFDLPEQRIGGWSYVARSFVYDAGGPDLGDSYADVSSFGRVSVG